MQAIKPGYAFAPKGGYRCSDMASPLVLCSQRLFAYALSSGFGLAMAVITSPAIAQTTPVTPPRVPPITQPPGATIMAEPVALFIATLDADGDARVTRAELRAGVEHSFAAIDTARTGSIGYIQMADWAERFLGDRNALPSAYETDSDGDNRISLGELTAQIDKTFTRFDRDKDNVLVRSELLTLDSGRAPNPFERGGKRGRGQ